MINNSLALSLNILWSQAGEYSQLHIGKQELC